MGFDFVLFALVLWASFKYMRVEEPLNVMWSILLKDSIFYFIV